MGGRVPWGWAVPIARQVIPNPAPSSLPPVAAARPLANVSRCMRKIGFLLVLFAAVSCSGLPQNVSPHTHLWTENPQHNVWTYQPVVRITINGNVTQTNVFLSRQLQPGETIVLRNGVSITYDGLTLRVGGDVIPTNILNMMVAPDGFLEKNVFIRTFY